MDNHEKKVARIVTTLQDRDSKAPLTLKKATVSHVVSKPQDKRHTDET